MLTLSIAFLGLSGYTQARTNTWISTTIPAWYTYGPKSVDLDTDGDNDLVISENGFLTKYINNGSGIFTNSGIIPGMRYPDKEFEFGDLDNDGDADLVLPYNEISGVVTGKIYLNNGAGIFTIIPGTFINKVGSYGFTTKIIDMNNDGKKDIVYVGTGNQTNPDHLQNIEVWLNTSTPGNVNFSLFSISNCTTPSRSTADFGDIDGDGDLDIATGGGGWGNEVFINNGNVFTSSYDNNDYTGYTYLIDWDGDGDKDLVYYDSYNNSGLRWRRNNGLGMFESTGTLLFNNVEAGASLSPYYHFTFADVNLDGFVDAAINSSFGTKILLNRGCSFELQPTIIGASGSSSSGLLAADFNNDGFKEIISAYDNSFVININDLVQTIAIPFSNITNTVPYLGAAGAASVSATASNGGTVRWWDSMSGGTMLGTGSTYTTTITNSTTFYASAINSNGCESGRTPVSATIGVIVNVDIINPTVLTKNISIYLDNNGSATINTNDINNGSTDNIGIVSLTLDKTDFDCSNIGENTVLLTASDAAGNSATASAVVTVVDNTNPIAISKNISINLINGTYILNASEVNNGSYDNCGIVSMNVYPNTFNCSSASSQTVNFVIQDASGNYSAATATITILSSTPNVTVNGSTAVANQASNTIYLGYGTQSIYLNATSSSSNVTYSWSPSTGLSNPNIANPVASPSSKINYTVTVTNANGCSASASIEVDVIDVRSRNSKGQFDGKVLICHMPPGNPSNSNALNVPSSAVPAHLAHGDKLGSCEGNRNRNVSGLIIDAENHFDVNAFPNPFNKDLTVYIDSHSNEPIMLKIYDSLGKLVYQKENAVSLTSLTIDAELPNGIYMLDAIQGSERRTIKLIKTN